MSNIQVLKDIQQTCKKSIRLTATPVIGPWNSNLGIYESKFGGIPYLPQGMEYPRNSAGEPMHLLAQINFIDMPYLEPFPRDGILQIYINNDDLYGMHFDNDDYNEVGHKVIYIPNDGNYGPYLDLNFLDEPSADFPINCPHKITFHSTTKPIPDLNPNFDIVFKKYLDNYEEGDDFYDLYSSLIVPQNTHQIGGYISFIQQGAHFDDNTEEVLLQIGADNKICFGDCGIATFIISKADLEKCDFSKVRYYWDCT